MSQPKSQLSRRTLFAGATTVGAAVAAVSLLPSMGGSAPAEVQPKAPPEKGGGYSLTDHVKQYYKTTLI